MKGAEIKLSYLIILAAGLAGGAAVLCRDLEHRLYAAPAGGVILRAQSSADEEAEDDEQEKETQQYTSRENRTEKGTAQKIFRDGANRKAEYHFINFNKDALSITFAMPDAEYRRYAAAYGYSDADLDILKSWREKTRQEAWKAALPAGGKAAADKAVADVDLEYDTRLRALLRSRGLALRAGNVVECDMPVIVKKNIKTLNPLAMAFQKLAVEKKYGEEDMVGAVVSMVQTAILCKIPPAIENGLHTGGLLPPAKSLLSGWGDCDTKTGLLASILYFGPARRAEDAHRRRVEDVIDFLRLSPYRHHPAGKLPYGVQKRVELGRAMAAESDLILLDEPMAGMNLEETEDMARYILDINEEWGMTVLLVEHDMGVVMDISSKVVVLDFGRVLAEGPPEAVMADPAVVAAYLGGEDAVFLGR